MKFVTKIGIIFLIVGCLGYFVLQHNMQHKEGVHIALLTPITHPALQEVEQGFKETLQKVFADAYYTTFNANGNKTLLRAQAEEAVSGSYNLIFTMGSSASQIVAELLAKKQLDVPHIFGAIDGYDTAHALQAIRPSSTGAYLVIDYTKQMDELFKLKPDIKNILLVYDPMHGTGLEKYKDQIAAYVTKFGATLDAIEIYNAHEIQQKVALSLPHYDVVLVLIDNTVVSGIDALIALCNKQNVILMASDVPSGKKGATIAYGITEYESGAQAAQKAIEVLQNSSMHEITPTPITEFNLLINRQAPQAQLLNIQAMGV